MSSLFFDCSKGLSGSMLVGALCDLGAKPSSLEWDLSQVDLGEFHAHFERVTESGVTGVKFSIHPGAVHTPDQDAKHDHDHDHDHDHKHEHEHDHEHDEKCVHSIPNLVASVERSALEDPVKARIGSIFQRLGQTHDALSLEEAAAVICATSALAAVKPERVAFFCREGTMDATIDSGSAFAAEFVSSSHGLPAIEIAKTGSGIGADGQSLRAVLGEPA
jgi:hypothetical protein